MKLKFRSFRCIFGYTVIRKQIGECIIRYELVLLAIKKKPKQRGGREVTVYYKGRLKSLKVCKSRLNRHW